MKGQNRKTAQWAGADCTTNMRKIPFRHTPRVAPPVGFVIGMQADFDIGSKHVPAACVLRQGVHPCQRVGGNGRAEPLDRIAVVIVVRRLDHHEVEQLLPQAARDNHRFAPWKQLNESTSACGLHRQSSSASLRNCYLYPLSTSI